MKKVMRCLVLAGFVGLGFSVASPASAACTGGSTLNGSFGILVGGTAVSGGSKFLTGVLNFDGACSFSGEVSYGLNGAVNYFTGASGTYNTSADNTITINLNVSGVTGTQTYQVGYAPNSNEALGIETDGVEIATIDLQAQTIPRSNIVYGAGSLKGTYSVECYGVGASYSDLNYVTFDGNGNLSGFDYFNNSGNQGTSAPYTGTFAVRGTVFSEARCSVTLISFNMSAQSTIMGTRYSSSISRRVPVITAEPAR